jgi:hypothetical protein
MLYLTAQTQLYVGRSQVDFATLARHWREADKQFVGIFYDRKTFTVNRLVVDGVLAVNR